jgi:hypothetical protein
VPQGASTKKAHLSEKLSEASLLVVTARGFAADEAPPSALLIMRCVSLGALHCLSLCFSGFFHCFALLLGIPAHLFLCFLGSLSVSAIAVPVDLARERRGNSEGGDEQQQQGKASETGHRTQDERARW